MKEKVERRSFERIARTFEVNYSSVRGFISEYAMNISRGGMFISTRNPLPAGTHVVLKFKIPPANTEITLEGEVVWAVRPEESGGTLIPGMGIKFTKMDEKTRNEIERIISEGKR